MKHFAYDWCAWGFGKKQLLSQNLYWLSPGSQTSDPCEMTYAMYFQQGRLHHSTLVQRSPWVLHGFASKIQICQPENRPQPGFPPLSPCTCFSRPIGDRAHSRVFPRLCRVSQFLWWWTCLLVWDSLSCSPSHFVLRSPVTAASTMLLCSENLRGFLLLSGQHPRSLGWHSGLSDRPWASFPLGTVCVAGGHAGPQR